VQIVSAAYEYYLRTKVYKLHLLLLLNYF
jgi:hypothetical protein